MRRTCLIGLIVLFFPVCALADTPPPAHAIIRELTTRKLPDAPGKEVLMLSVEYPPGSADPVHRHDAEAFVYVLEGSIVMGVNGEEPVTLRAGQTFHEGPHDVHTIGRNASSTEPARFVVFLLKDVGKPALVPVDGSGSDSHE